MIVHGQILLHLHTIIIQVFQHIHFSQMKYPILNLCRHHSIQIQVQQQLVMITVCMVKIVANIENAHYRDIYIANMNSISIRNIASVKQPISGIKILNNVVRIYLFCFSDLR